MVLYSTTLDATFGALSDPTRRAILARLSAGRWATSELAAPFDMTLTAVTKHLSVLEHAGLVERRKTGRVVHCSLNAARMQEAAEWLAGYQRFWQAKLDALGHFLSQAPDEETAAWPRTPRNPSRSGSPSDTRSRRRKSSARGPNRKR